MAKKTYFVIEPLRHDGDDYAVGAKVSLESAAAEALIAAGVVSSTTPAAEEPSAESSEQ